MMTARLQHAITSLYQAFHTNNLEPLCACKCAVGSICEGKDFWKHLSDDHGSLKLNYVGLVHQQLGKRFYGYTPQELLAIEHTFLKACGYQIPLHHKNNNRFNPKNKNIQFNGLCAVIEYLCALDKHENVMNITQVFEAAIPSSAVDSPRVEKSQLKYATV